MANFLDLVQAGIGIYTAYEASRAARAQAEAASEAAETLSKQASTAKLQGLEQLKLLKANAAAQRKQFERTLSQTRLQTEAIAGQASASRAAAEQQIIQQKRSSALAIQQQQLQAAIQRQQAASPVGSPVRRRVGTPAAMRTSLEIQSPLSGGVGMGTPNAIGGLNV